MDNLRDSNNFPVTGGRLYRDNSLASAILSPIGGGIGTFSEAVLSNR